MLRQQFATATLLLLFCLSLTGAEINECDSNPCDSEAVCQNTFGSFQCWCPRGHRLEGSDCQAESEHAIEMSLLVRGVSATELQSELEMFTWLFASTLTKTNPARVAYTAIVDTENTPWGAIVTVNAMLDSEKEGEAAVKRFFESSPSFKDKVAETLSMQVVHYGSAISPAQRPYKAAGSQAVEAPSTFSIDGVELDAFQVTHTADSVLHLLAVTFTPDQSFVLPDKVEFLSASSIRVGSGDDVANAELYPSCSFFLADAAAQADYAAVLSRPCAPDVSPASLCDVTVTNLAGPVTVYVPVRSDAVSAGHASVFVQLEVSMASPTTGIAYTLPLGATLPATALSDNLFCPVSAEQPPAPSTPPPTASSVTEGDDPESTTAADEEKAEEGGQGSFGASYDADGEVLTAAVASEEGEWETPEMPTMAVGSGAAVMVVVAASGAGAVLLRRRKTQKRRAGESAGPSESVWLDDVQTQITSDFMLATGPDSRDKGLRGHAPESLQAVDHVTRGVSRREMSHRIAGHADDNATVTAVVCVDDGTGTGTGLRAARTVDSPALVAAAAEEKASVVAAMLHSSDGGGDRKRRLSASLTDDSSA